MSVLPHLPPSCRTRRRVLHAIALPITVPIIATLGWSSPVHGAAVGLANLPERFDPRRDPAADLANALALAQQTGRRVMVDLGGEWCTWCHIMDRFFAAHPDLQALRERHYVWLKINYSRENPNTAFLKRWPKVQGYPHLFVLDASGALLHSQDTSALESGRSYSIEAVRALLARWARSGDSSV